MAILRMQEPRQLYGLGSLVKKITRPIKKIIKSPIGKIGLGALALGGMGGFSGGGTLASVGQSLGATPGIFINSFGLNTAALVGFGATSLAGSVAMGMMAPKTPDYSGYTPVSQYAQQYNSQQIETTGSGGRQAAASLAEAVQRSRQRKLSQEDVGDLSIDTSAFASTGLQLA